jgi:hypothetical protein
MSYSTYFEIGGQVIETSMPGIAPRPAADPLMELAKKHGVSKPLARKAIKETSDAIGYDIHRASQAYGRYRRARWAFTTAAVLAAADGPLPFGDIAAIGLLGVYGGYETVAAFGDLRQK